MRWKHKGDESNGRMGAKRKERKKQVTMKKVSKRRKKGDRKSGKRKVTEREKRWETKVRYKDKRRT